MEIRHSAPHTIGLLMLFAIPFQLVSHTTYDAQPFVFGSQAKEAHAEFMSYILRIQFPSSLKKIPALCGYYKGYNLEFDADYCIIQEDPTCDRFTIAITERVHRKIDDRNLQYLERVPGRKKCRLFYVTRNHTDESKPWTIEEELDENIPVKLPRTALVLFLNPEHVDTLSCDKGSFKTTSIIKGPVVTLPYVAIKSNIPSKDLERTSITALLASLDSRAIHPHVPKEVKIERTTIVSMRTPSPTAHL